MQNQLPSTGHVKSQFSLAALLEFATVCAILSALFRPAGVASAVFLMLMALALGARQGMLAIAMVFGAALSADISAKEDGGESGLQRQASVLLIAALLCGWYLFRRQFDRYKAIRADQAAISGTKQSQSHSAAGHDVPPNDRDSTSID